MQRTISHVYKFLNRHKLIYVFIVILIYGNYTSEAFFSSYNLVSLLRMSGITGLLVLGESLVILTKGIDLSIGWIASLSTVVVAAVSVNFNEALNPIPLIIVALFCAMSMGAFLGFINGISVAILKVNPLITTLASMWIAQGLAMIILRGVPTRIPIKEFTNIGRLKIFGTIPVILIIFLIIALIVYSLLKKIRFGRFVYAVGGNEYAAYLSGINVKAIKIIVYTLSGLLASMGGILMAAWTRTGEVGALAGYELTAIAAVVMGGISLTGGEGNIWDGILGAFILVTIRKILIFGGINPWLLGFFTGLLLLLSVHFIQERIETKI